MPEAAFSAATRSTELTEPIESLDGSSPCPVQIIMRSGMVPVDRRATPNLFNPLPCRRRFEESAILIFPRLPSVDWTPIDPFRTQGGLDEAV
jgi:hypothetical protein